MPCLWGTLLVFVGPLPPAGNLFWGFCIRNIFCFKTQKPKIYASNIQRNILFFHCCFFLYSEALSATFFLLMHKYTWVPIAQEKIQYNIALLPFYASSFFYKVILFAILLADLEAASCLAPLWAQRALPWVMSYQCVKADGWFVCFFSLLYFNAEEYEEEGNKKLGT